MSGRFEDGCEAQLAVMDAVVFFVAATAISTMVLSYASPDNDHRLDGHGGDVDPAEVLNVFLMTSLGERLTLEIGRPVVVDGSEDVASCLALEVSALKAGREPGVFAGMNSVLEGMLVSLCNPVFEPHLIVFERADAGWSVLFALLGVTDRTWEAYASSAGLMTDDETECLVELVLTPSSSSEDINV